MPIIFMDGPPYDPLFARSAEAQPTLDGVRLVLNVEIPATADDQLNSTVSVRILLEPEVARALAGQIGPVATAVDN